MASAQQITRLVDRLYEKTLGGALDWQRSVEPGKFVVRIGQHSMQISASNTLMTIPSVVLGIYRLDGTHVESIGNSANVFATRQQPPLSPATQEKLVQLYKIISSTDQDIDQLLKDLG